MFVPIVSQIKLRLAEDGAGATLGAAAVPAQGFLGLDFVRNGMLETPIDAARIRDFSS